MPFTSAADIAVVLSGGTVNLDPNKSLGGDPSSTPITSNVLNNLFADVTSDESAAGLTDFRCIYLFNDGQTPIYNVAIWINADLDTGGGSVQIGVLQQNETQRVTVTGTPTGGSFTLNYNGFQFNTNWNADLSVWANNLQTAINSLVDNDSQPIFDHVVVTATNSANNTTVFDIRFANKDAARSINQFLLTGNAMLPNGQVGVFVSTPQPGGPINTIASEIGIETTPPGGVGFFSPSKISPISLPVLRPTEGFPLWVTRIIPAGTTAQQDDGFTLSFKAESLAP